VHRADRFFPHRVVPRYVLDLDCGLYIALRARLFGGFCHWRHRLALKSTTYARSKRLRQPQIDESPDAVWFDAPPTRFVPAATVSRACLQRKSRPYRLAPAIVLKSVHFRRLQGEAIRAPHSRAVARRIQPSLRAEA